MRDRIKSVTANAIPGLMFMVFTAGCAGVETPAQPEPVPEIHPGLLQGYLSKENLPNSLSLLPPAPAKGAAADKLDQKISQSSLSLRGTPRWELAMQDANLHFPDAADTFSCALNAPITQQQAPHLYRLLRRSLADAGLATMAAKNHYSRKRPFQENKNPTCTPDDEAKLSKNGSYPSGHSAIGWAWALILSELDPERIDDLLARGRAFGQSRVICNVHWQSDVIDGRLVGAAVYARLQSEPAYMAAIESAKVELAAVRKKGLSPQRDCEAEKKALSIYPKSAPWPANK